MGGLIDVVTFSGRLTKEIVSCSSLELAIYRAS